MSLAYKLYYLGFFFIVIGLFYPAFIYIGLTLAIVGVGIYGHHYQKMLIEAEKFLKKANKRKKK